MMTPIVQVLKVQTARCLSPSVFVCFYRAAAVVGVCVCVLHGVTPAAVSSVHGGRGDTGGRDGTTLGKHTSAYTTFIIKAPFLISFFLIKCKLALKRIIASHDIHCMKSLNSFILKTKQDGQIQVCGGQGSEVLTWD